MYGYVEYRAQPEPDWAAAEGTVEAMIEAAGGLSTEACAWAEELLHGAGTNPTE